MTTFCDKSSAGRKAKLYRNTGTVPIPVWEEFTEARDLSLPMSADKFDDPSRGSIFKLFDQGQVETGISFQLTYREGSLQCKAIRDLILSGCAEEFAIMSGPIATAGSEGLRGGMKVFTNDTSFPIADGSTVDVELAPCYFEDAGDPGTQIFPAWYTVS